jgi:hypothetical protein
MLSSSEVRLTTVAHQKQQRYGGQSDVAGDLTTGYVRCRWSNLTRSGMTIVDAEDLAAFLLLERLVGVAVDPLTIFFLGSLLRGGVCDCVWF